VIEFWRAVEMFSPPAIPAARPSQRVFDIEPDQPLPWESGHPLRRQQLPEKRAWRHTVYLGLYPRENVFEVLKGVFPADSDSFEERPSGSSALLAFAVSDGGIMLESSVVLSACAWATGSALDPGPTAADWLDGFADIEGQFALRLEEIYLGWEDGEKHPTVLRQASLAECLTAAAEELGVAKALGAEGVRVRSEMVAAENAETVDHDFLNSFIADDLARVASASGRGDVGPALREYLRPNAELETGDRVDVRTKLDEVRLATAPERVPLGRWPASPDHPLALGQQLAVNVAAAPEDSDARLFAVNGPPGTGKTTTLRDLVAALVTERAERLATLRDPADAFLEEPERWKTTHYQRTVHRLRPELTGFELVVASSNNGAVENVTLEMPSDKAIDAVWRERAQEVDYLSRLAGRAMGAEKKKRAPRGLPEPAAWALVAARLGNSKNRKDFVNAVWWTERPEHDDRPPPPTGLRDLLKGWEVEPEGPSWADAVAAFRRAHDRTASIRDQRLHTNRQLDRMGELESELEIARRAERAAVERVESSRPRHERVADALRVDDEERERRVGEREELRRLRPSAFRLRARAEWRDHDRQLAAEVAKLDARLGECREELRLLEDEVQTLVEAEAAVVATERERDQCQEAILRYREQPGASLPDGEWLEDRRARELRAPWSDSEWNEARSELFLAALALHKAFLVHAARPMRESLDGAMEILSGNAPSNLSAEAALAAWQALFLLVPVISTTFASVSRLLGPLGPERSAGCWSTRPARPPRRTWSGRSGAPGARSSSATRCNWNRSPRFPFRPSRRSATTTGWGRSG
jgi:hypothetical protein